ncbi:MAG: helix-turn-helix transcriptional regulator [Clostridia bacterium]|nr:helix-turn-helix transcriptional regulator [Clostridia bacterium]
MRIEVKEFVDQTNFASGHFLQINSCGFQRNGTERYTVLRTNGRQDYHFLYVTKGCVVAETKIGDVALHAGDLLLYRPFEKQLYSHGVQGESCSCWIHFSGTGAEDLLESAGFLANQVFHVGLDSTLIQLLERMVSHFQPRSKNLLCISFLVQFCALAGKNNTETLHTDKRIAPALAYMNTHYTKNYSNDYYAKLCGISETRFSHLFKQIMDVSPHRYILRLKLDRVQYLLTYSDMTVAEIASVTGFPDALYLSRLFKKQKGMSPTEFKHRYRV